MSSKTVLLIESLITVDYLFFPVEVQLFNWVRLKHSGNWAFGPKQLPFVHGCIISFKKKKKATGKWCSSRDPWCCWQAATLVPAAVHSLRFWSVHDHISACALTPLEPMQADQHIWNHLNEVRTHLCTWNHSSQQESLFPKTAQLSSFFRCI